MWVRAAITGAIWAALPLAATAQAPVGKPIPGDGAWTLYQVPNGGCYARLPGNQVDTMVMVNRDARPVLSVGRPDWSLGGADFTAGLSINGGPAHQLTVSPVDVMFLVSIGDDLKNQVLSATSLTWTLPSGRFTASVQGLGKAFKTVVPCGLEAAKAAPPATAPAH